jgi:hypothetical protein
LTGLEGIKHGSAQLRIVLPGLGMPGMPSALPVDFRTKDIRPRTAARARGDTGESSPSAGSSPGVPEIRTREAESPPLTVIPLYCPCRRLA